MNQLNQLQALMRTLRLTETANHLPALIREG